MEHYNDGFAHSGIMGMKWGIRKRQSEGGSGKKPPPINISPTPTKAEVRYGPNLKIRALTVHYGPDKYTTILKNKIRNGGQLSAGDIEYTGKLHRGRKSFEMQDKRPLSLTELTIVKKSLSLDLDKWEGDYNPHDESTFVDKKIKL